MNRVAFVSSGLLAPKKSDHPFARRHKYLNYGLLTLASIVGDAGYEPRLFHGGFDDPCDVAYSVAAWLGDSDSPLLLSIPSFYAVEWAHQFVSAMKGALPGVRIIVGGRWVIGQDASWLFQRLQQIDLAVFGTAEDRIVDLLNEANWCSVPGTQCTGYFAGASDGNYYDLRYEVAEDFGSFQPSVEVSRGCGMGCTFCEERSVPLQRIRAPKSVVSALVKTARAYKTESIHPYFEASWFVPSPSWVKELLERYVAEGLNIRWRCESRVDSFATTEIINNLARAGLRMIDLGLESGSPLQLTRMGKSSKPGRYLSRASDLLRACHDAGIWPKVNVLLYAGETKATLSETQEWLEAHRSYIKGVSVGPVVAYGQDIAGTMAWMSHLGAEPVDTRSALETGITRLHLSREIDWATSEELGINLSRRFMSGQDYFDLKSFSYLPRHYTRRDFNDDLRVADQSLLPFAVGSRGTLSPGGREGMGQFVDEPNKLEPGLSDQVGL